MFAFALVLATVVLHSSPSDAPKTGSSDSLIGSLFSAYEDRNPSDSPASYSYDGYLMDDTYAFYGPDGIFVNRNRPYLAAYEGLQVVDLSDPNNLRSIDKARKDCIIGMQDPFGIILNGELAYVTSSGTGGTRILDVTNPNDLQYIEDETSHLGIMMAHMKNRMKQK